MAHTQNPPGSGLHVGVLGTGVMGGGMAHRLLEQGYRVTVYNRTASRVGPLVEEGATAVGSAAELAADCDVVLISLANEGVVDAMLFGPGGVFETLPEHGVVMDTSTVSPQFARSESERAAARGSAAVDACVIGNGDHARAGELRFMVGGSAEAFARVSPVLEALSKEVRHLGGSGLGASAKVMLNLLMGAEMQMVAEAVVLARRAGIDRDLALQMIGDSGYSSPVMRFKTSVMRRRAYSAPQFRLDLMRKDLQLAVSEAGRLDVAAPVTTATLDRLVQAAEAGLGDLDCAAVLAHAEALAGLEPRPVV
ncbi:NAD(P)-dependent oxidoreductase [Streptomyces sp. NPDC049954]|uniref:NAD(P)-dependent oxidoreductase n=1 Tax=Streptomyces sp. NPDC049954 TaxID=3155779 RepID=UPI0034148CE3